MSPSKQQIKKEETDKNIDVTTTEDQSSSIPSSTTSADDTSERSVKDQSSDSSRPSQKKVSTAVATMYSQFFKYTRISCDVKTTRCEKESNLKTDDGWESNFSPVTGNAV